MSSVRVLQVLTNLAFGGAQMCAVNLCEGLRRRGWDVQVAFSSRGGKGLLENGVLVHKLKESGVPVHDVSSLRRQVSPWNDLRALRGLRRLIRELRPEIVHTRMSKSGIVGRLAAAAEQVPHIVHTVDGWSFYSTASPLSQRIYTALERLAARPTECWVAVSPLLIEEGLRVGIPVSNYVIIRSGIDMDTFSQPANTSGLREQLGIPQGVPVVGAVMALSAAKAPLDFVTVVASIAREVPAVHFLMIGDGPLRDVLHAAIARHGLGERLHLAGVRHDVPHLLGLMDVFVLTSRWEGLPRVVVEAMAAGVPVVATQVGAIAELVTPGVTGLLAPPGNIPALADRVLALLQNPLRARSIAVEARKRVAVEFDTAAVVNRHEELYARLLQASRRPVLEDAL